MLSRSSTTRSRHSGVAISWHAVLVAQFEALRETRSRREFRLGGPVDRAIEWTAAGIVGDFAWHLLLTWWRGSRAPSGAYTISDEDIAAFVEMYLGERIQESTDLIPIELQLERTSDLRGSRMTNWKFVFVGRNREYTVVLQASGDSVLPSVVVFSERASPPSRFDRFGPRRILRAMLE